MFLIPCPPLPYPQIPANFTLPPLVFKTCRTLSTPPPTSGQQQDTGRGSTGWSALTEAMKMVGPAAITQEFSKKLLKWQADVGGELTKCDMF